MTGMSLGGEAMMDDGLDPGSNQKAVGPDFLPVDLLKLGDPVTMHAVMPAS